MLAIVEALQHWQPYLHDTKFIVNTDHSPLIYFFAQPNLSPANYAGLKFFFFITSMEYYLVYLGIHKHPSGIHLLMP